jgi:hypothetical protein
MKKTTWAWIGLVALFAVGCGEDADDVSVEEGEESPEEEACEHMAEGPAQAVTASAVVAEAPDGTAEHTRIDVALVDVSGTVGGFVNYEAAEDGEYVFFLNDDSAFTLRDAVGVPLASESSGPVAECGEVVVFHQYDLEVGTYIMDFEGSDETSVSVVVEALGEHSDE